MHQDTRFAQSGIMVAIWNRSLSAIKECLDLGADPHMTSTGLNSDKFYRSDENTFTAVQYAVQYAIKQDNCAVLIFMEENGIDITSAINDIFTPKFLMEANTGGNFIDFIIKRWPESQGNWMDVFKIHDMVRQKHASKIYQLIKYGADVNERDEKGRTPLMMSRAPWVTQSLLACSADIKALDNKGRSATWHAVQYTIRKISNKNGKPPTVSSTDIMTLTSLIRTLPLKEDPAAANLVKQLRRQIDLGLTIDSTPVKDSSLGVDILPQIEEIEAAEKFKKLGRFVRGHSVDINATSVSQKGLTM